MSDADLRQLERAYAAGNLAAGVRLCEHRIRLTSRDPRRDPQPGNVVIAPAGNARKHAISRRIVGCTEFQERVWADRMRGTWAAQFNYSLCSNEGCRGRVHWIRYSGIGPRSGILFLVSWRSWARGGFLLEIAPVSAAIGKVS